MIVNPDKFQVIVVKRSKKMKNSYTLNIKQQVINLENCVELLGLEIDNKLSSELSIQTSITVLLCGIFAQKNQ